MATNPNPARISAEMWRFWEEFKKIEPTVQLGGIYGNKPGYHNTRLNLPKDDYSVQLAADKLGPGDKSAGIDLTFPDAQSGDYRTINKYSLRLYRSGKDVNDPRGNYLREFYGNIDTDSAVEGFDFVYLVNVTSDSSHLWHIHLSFLRMYMNVREAFDAILSILRGESVAQWEANKSPDKIYIEGVGVATVADVAKAVWEYKLHDMVSNQPQKAGDFVRYTRIDAYRPTPQWLAAIGDWLKGFLPVCRCEHNEPPPS